MWCFCSHRQKVNEKFSGKCNIIGPKQKYVGEHGGQTVQAVTLKIVPVPFTPSIKVCHLLCFNNNIGEKQLEKQVKLY